MCYAYAFPHYTVTFRVKPGDWQFYLNINRQIIRKTQPLVIVFHQVNPKPLLSELRCSRWELNPQNRVFETRMFSNYITWTIRDRRVLTLTHHHWSNTQPDATLSAISESNGSPKFPELACYRNTYDCFIYTTNTVGPERLERSISWTQTRRNSHYPTDRLTNKVSNDFITSFCNPNITFIPFSFWAWVILNLSFSIKYLFFGSR